MKHGEVQIACSYKTTLFLKKIFSSFRDNISQRQGERIKVIVVTETNRQQVEKEEEEGRNNVRLTKEGQYENKIDCFPFTLKFNVCNEIKCEKEKSMYRRK